MINRVAVVFDNTARPETTGLYCRRALGCLVDVEHFLPDEIDRIPRNEFDLFLNIDDGLRYEWPADLRPSACWLIDTHIDFEWALSKARQFDCVFAAQQDGARRLREAGIESAVWLPLAADPEIHSPCDVDKPFDVTFIGNLFPGPRSDLLQALQRRFERVFVGRRYLDEMAAAYSASQLVFNRSVANDVNMRVFEALACGSLLITNALKDNGQEQLFQDGVHLATYADEAELLDKCEFYLQHHDVRERIARQGRSELLSKHTYLHRMHGLLRQVEARNSQQNGHSLVPSWPDHAWRPSWNTVQHEKAVSACLVSWQRPENLRDIVQHLLQQPMIDDIVIWNNDPGQALEFDNDRVTVIASEQNIVTYGRFLATRHAKHDLIYTQDDDCLVHNLAELYGTFLLDPQRMTHALKLDHLIRNSENTFGDMQMGLLGWGAFFPKQAVNALEQYRAVYGEDTLLWRKADRIFSLLQHNRHRPVPADVTDLQGASGPAALSVRHDHLDLTREAIDRCLNLDTAQADANPADLRADSQNGTEKANSTIPIGTTAAGAKDQTYFEFARPELLALVPQDAHSVLDIGCGSGVLGQTIKARQPAEVWGVERDPMAAELATARLDRVLCADVEAGEASLPNGFFDCVICGDVLEHLRQPEKVLRQIREWLAPQGVLIASLPNVRHHSVVTGLLNGNWTYESAGLLDQDHVRFFTRREIEKLFYRAGFAISETQVVPGPGYAEWESQGRPGSVNVGGLQIGELKPEDAEEFYVYQYLIAATADSNAPLNRIVQVQAPVTAGDSPLPARADDKSAIMRLAQEHPWPSHLPNVPIPDKETGWLADGARKLLAEALSDETNLVVELGSWLGMSTRFIADRAPQATIVCVDHWLGSPEHREKPRWREMLPTLYDTFLAMCWSYRQQLVPMKTTTQAGLQAVDDFGLQPDLIFIDAEHSYEAVFEELTTCQRLFPAASIVGDDYDAPGVGEAARAFAAAEGCRLELAGNEWRAWKLVRPDKVEASVASTVDYGLTSIIILTHNQLSYTHQCLSSIRQFTDEEYELILVDNGSTDGTPEYLHSLSGAKVIANSENRGFPSAVNQGLEIATGRQVLLLNNDVIVTTGWLRRMLEALYQNADVGLVGPCSNNVSGPQQIPVSYQNLSSLDGFAWDWGCQQAGRQVDVDRLVGFCLLIRQEVIDKIGRLDERFGMGCFEDDDYSRRARAAGYRAVIAQDAFVHHFGSRTFLNSDIDFAEQLRTNQRLYEEKWSNESVENSSGNDALEKPVQSAAALQSFAVRSNEHGPGLLLSANPIKLSLCMIVRDNENTLEPCLASIRPWVDELIVVDTGSTDRTPQIAQQYGARVYEFPWCDDFARARNESIKYAKGEWVFWMDSDDTIDGECGHRLRELAYGEHQPETLGYVIQVHCPGPGADGHQDVTVVDHVKLFRNHRGITFEGRIHEQLIPAIRRAGGEVAWTDLFVIHSGSDHTPEGRERKLERDFRLLNLELAEQPDHPFVLFNLGMTHADTQEFDEAIGYLKRCIEVSNIQESHLRKAFAILVSCYAQLDQHDLAWETCKRGVGIFPQDQELLFRQAMLHQHFGRLQESVDTYLRVLTEQEERHFTSVDRGIAGYKARHNLALVYEEMKDLRQAEGQWTRITEEQPDYRAGWRGLVELLLTTNRVVDARKIVDSVSKKSGLASLAQLLLAKCDEHDGDVASACNKLNALTQENTNDVDAHRELCRLLFAYAHPLETETALNALAEIVPDDGSIFHNLGSVHLRLHRIDEAAQDFERSLTLRPDSIPTMWQLQGIYIDSGKHEKAIKHLYSILSLDPNHTEARQALLSLTKN